MLKLDAFTHHYLHYDREYRLVIENLMGLESNLVELLDSGSMLFANLG
jgi:hypothetical protein